MDVSTSSPPGHTPESRARGNHQEIPPLRDRRRFQAHPRHGETPTSQGVKQNEYKTIKQRPLPHQRGERGGTGGGILLGLTKPHKNKIHSIMYNSLTRGVVMSGGDAVTAL